MSDSISRQDAIRWVKTECNPYGRPTLDFESGKKVIEHLEMMPSADRPTGKWILLNECANSGYYCSECHKKIVKEGWYSTVKKIKYCPNCGADMRNK